MIGDCGLRIADESDFNWVTTESHGEHGKGQRTEKGSVHLTFCAFAPLRENMNR